MGVFSQRLLAWEKDHRWLVRHRENRVVAGAASVLRVLLSSYDNYNYNPSNNGELDVLRSVGPCSVVFDVGANVGDWTLLAAPLHPDAAIYCFEPAEETRYQLINRTSHLSNVTVADVGLLDAEGTVDLRHFPDETEFSTVIGIGETSPGFERALHSSVPSEILRVDVTTGDRYARDHGIQHIDLLKIDVEGAENLVLEGFRQMLEARRVDMVQFEYGYPNAVTKFLLRDFYILFNELDFEVGKIFPGHVDFRDYRVEDEDFRGPNFLAVSRTRPDLLKALS